jgi:hypothetical protein
VSAPDPKVVPPTRPVNAGEGAPEPAAAAPAAGVPLVLVVGLLVAAMALAVGATMLVGAARRRKVRTPSEDLVDAER